MRNASLDESQTGIIIVGKNTNNSRYTNDTIIMIEKEEELKSLWWVWKRRVKKLA